MYTVSHIHFCLVLLYIMLIAEITIANGTRVVITLLCCYVFLEFTSTMIMFSLMCLQSALEYDQNLSDKYGPVSG